MKKLLSLLLALAMLLGCVAMAETVDYTGIWVLTGAEAAGVQMGPTMLGMMGMDMTISLDADGTATLTMMGEAEAGTWTATETGVAISDGTDTLTAIYADEVLLLEQDGTLLMFTREGAAPAVDEAPQASAVLANVDPLAFEGQWLLTSANFMGMDFTTDMMGVYIAFVLVGGEGVFGESNEEGGVDQYPITYTVTEVEGVGTVLDLIYSGEDVEEPVVLMSLNMQEDGRLVMKIAEEGMEISYYFTLQVEEAAE